MDDAETAPSLSPLSVAAQTIAFSVFGLFLIADAVPALISAGINKVLANYVFADTDVASFYESFDLARMARDIVRFLFGLSLLIGPRGFVGAIQRYRNYALDLKPEPDLPDESSQP